MIKFYDFKQTILTIFFFDNFFRSTAKIENNYSLTVEFLQSKNFLIN